MNILEFNNFFIQITFILYDVLVLILKNNQNQNQISMDLYYYLNLKIETFFLDDSWVTC